ncbi:hypothetical protein CPB83DRAFT_856871 [Crepidotus variabilis]|uniref:Uncharacterized protein n=1 Tax=Crepidotus variabilis TaxID=179855 RepID=A0A9P6JN27_9AGAR|nr:hypothetical protein CPB83DRAFT_856871 [Crepidotus variabilis]
MVGLKHIIASMSTSRASIQNATDVSEAYAVSLRKQEQDLVDDKRYRQEQNQSTLNCWRQRRLLLIWEAGLTCAGLLQRWRIVVVVNE